MKSLETRPLCMPLVFGLKEFLRTQEGHWLKPKAQPEEIVFTSGGTESINMALKGTAEAFKRTGKHIISSPVEHDAAQESLNALSAIGYEVEYLRVDEFGRYLLMSLKQKSGMIQFWSI